MGNPNDNQQLADLYESAQRNKDKYQYENPGVDKLATFPTPSHADQVVRVHCPEFTSLCPVTGQPDFAQIYISYIPRELCVESKSLKLYLMAYRNHGDFHEACVNRIFNDLKQVMQEPYALRVLGDFTPRGGLAIKPVSEYVMTSVADKSIELVRTLQEWGPQCL